ncbi:hypothetical protein V8G54_023476 [Vigna mungo]|uniref:Uncharacterized protein n=1 Tax=Vigna mungo TaxID=3915 RepID=A0AAQ3N373_VIGMU
MWQAPFSQENEGAVNSSRGGMLDVGASYRYDLEFYASRKKHWLMEDEGVAISVILGVICRRKNENRLVVLEWTNTWVRVSVFAFRDCGFLFAGGDGRSFVTVREESFAFLGWLWRRSRRDLSDKMLTQRRCVGVRWLRRCGGRFCFCSGADHLLVKQERYGDEIRSWITRTQQRYQSRFTVINIMVVLPVVKLATLALKTACKPIANRLKKEAGYHPKFCSFIIAIAQANHRLTTRVQRRIYGRATDVAIRPLNEEKVVQAAADLLGELFCYLSAGIISRELCRCTAVNKEAVEKVEDSHLKEESDKGNSAIQTRNEELAREMELLAHKLEKLEQLSRGRGLFGTLNFGPTHEGMMRESSKGKFGSSSIQSMKEKEKHLVDKIQGIFSNLQCARKEGRGSDIVIFEEQMHQLLREWKAELESPATSLAERLLADFQWKGYMDESNITGMRGI